MRNYLLYRLVFVLSLLVAMTTSALETSAAEIAPEVENLLNNARMSADIPVIITRTGGIDVSALRAPNKTALRRLIVSNLIAQSKTNLVPLIAYLKQNGAQRVRELWMINSVAAVLPSSTVEKLRTYPGISIIRLDEVVQVPELLPAVTSPLEWNIAAVGASELWNLGYSGTNVVVATMDSGVDVDHLDLAARWRAGTNSWYDPNDEHPVTPMDRDGHGTAVMSVILGGDATGSAIGVAPGAQWIAVKIFNDAGLAENSAIHLGFQWLLDPDGDPTTDDAPDVINNSWGFRGLVDRCYLEFQTDIQTLKTAGIAVVFSAGNEGPNPSTSISPANNPESFAVGSVDSNFVLASTSSRGPSACIIDNDIFPELVAPGVDIKAADLTFNGLVPDASAYYDGTSFSAPHVAGGMALLMDAFPDRNLEDLEATLIDSATDLGIAGPDDDYGFGMLNILAAYRTLVPCTDVDEDGYYVETVCATPQDCDDNDPDVYPGATETKHDGIDQDCNGYDLTIDITTAAYFPGTDVLLVIATSDRMGSAGLQVDGVGPMNWNGPAHHWELTVSSVGGDPGSVTVSGAEGSESTAMTVCTDADGDGYYSDETCGSLADCDDADPMVFPGAIEIKHDGIDQDCNNYDLTIEIIKANYYSLENRLEVYATSGLNELAQLEIIGIGALQWVAERQRWEGIFQNISENPGSVTVAGIEGSTVKDTCVNPCAADINMDGIVGMPDFALFSAAFGSVPGDLRWNALADFNDDGIIGMPDFAILSSEFGRTDCPYCE